jgi:acetyl esterase/lipase
LEKAAGHNYHEHQQASEHQSMAEIDTSKRIVYRVDGMERIAPKRNLVYRSDNGTDLLMDVYVPLDVSPGTRLPAMLFVHGPIPADMQPPKDWGDFRSYGELAAASGLIGVTFNHRFHTPIPFPESQADVLAAIDYVRAHGAELHVDSERIGLWLFSGSGPHASWVLREQPSYLRCLLAFYPVLDMRHVVPSGLDAATMSLINAASPAAYVRELAGDLPMFVARAGLDVAMINQGIDLFVREALAGNASLDLANHPKGHHGFASLDDDDRSRAIISNAIAFAKAHLRSTGPQS